MDDRIVETVDDCRPSEARVSGSTIAGVFFLALVVVGSGHTLAVLHELMHNGVRANLGWGVLGLLIIQTPIAILASALALFYVGMNGPTDRTLRVVYAAMGMAWICLAFVGFFFHNHGC